MAVNKSFPRRAGGGMGLGGGGAWEMRERVEVGFG